MSTGVKVVLGLVAGLFVGGVGGFVAGLGAGATGGALAVGTQWASSEATHTVEMVEALKKLRAKQNDEALEELEKHLNKHVYGLMPQTHEGIPLQPDTLERLEEAKAQAKAYRTAHPRPDSPDLLSKDVAEFLAGE